MNELWDMITKIQDAMKHNGTPHTDDWLRLAYVDAGSAMLLNMQAMDDVVPTVLARCAIALAMALPKDGYECERSTYKPDAHDLPYHLFVIAGKVGEAVRSRAMFPSVDKFWQMSVVSALDYILWEPLFNIEEHIDAALKYGLPKRYNI